MPSRQNLTQRQANNLMADARPSDPDKIQASKRRKALDATRELFKQYKGTPLGYCLEFFGADLIVSGAFLLTPFDRYNIPGLIAGFSRNRQRTKLQQPYQVFHYTRTREYRNYVFNEINYIVDLHLVGESVVDFSYWITPVEIPNDYCLDSTVKTRTYDNTYTEYGLYASKQAPQYGELLMGQCTVTPDSVRRIYHTIVDEYHYATQKIEKIEAFTHFYCDGALAVPNSTLFVPDIEDAMFIFMNNRISSVLPRALLGARLWNPIYQTAELKDLRNLPKVILNFKEYVRKLTIQIAKDPGSIPEEVSNFFLGFNFGLYSTVESVKDLIDLPSAVTKRFNYLLERAGKLTTSRAKQTFKNAFPDWVPPSFTFQLPDYVEVLDEDVTYSSTAEMRVVVSQVINWPKVAVPSFYDSNYRELYGLNLSLTDIYNLIPWTWMYDWYTGLGNYLNMFEAIYSDKNLVNVGFCTVVVTETITHSAKLKVTNGRKVYFVDDIGGAPTELTFEESIDRYFPYKRVYTRKSQRRVSLGSLDGVKTFGFWQQNLSDFQSKILGALFLQRAK